MFLEVTLLSIYTVYGARCQVKLLVKTQVLKKKHIPILLIFDPRYTNVLKL